MQRNFTARSLHHFSCARRLSSQLWLTAANAERQSMRVMKTNCHTLHPAIFSLELQQLSQSHCSTVSDFPGRAEEINLEYLGQAIPYPTALRYFQSLGLLLCLGDDCTAFRWVDDYFIVFLRGRVPGWLLPSALAGGSRLFVSCDETGPV